MKGVTILLVGPSYSQTENVGTTVYEAPDAARALKRSTVGWSRTYADNWSANFGTRRNDNIN